MNRMQILLLLLALSPAVLHAQGTGGTIIVDSNVGYIDPAIPANQIRFRYDSNYDLQRPNRAEFFWRHGNPIEGRPRPESTVDYQDFNLYTEVAPGADISFFFELPLRLMNPEINDNTAGLIDLTAGFKYALIQSDTFVASAQLRVTAPTGDADRGLGTGHTVVETGLLAWWTPCDCWRIESELRLIVPLGGSDFAGEVLRYGVGAGYRMHTDDGWRITPIVEFVGWTVLDGKAGVLDENGVPMVVDADGDTIVNAKLGLRIGRDNWDAYVGYGQALTGETWYEKTFRFELRFGF